MFPYSYFTENVPNGDAVVEVSERRLREALAPLIEQIEVEEIWYRRNNIDVDEAIRKGIFKSAADHYRVAGYFENRQPRSAQVDEVWYLNEYPDVADAVTRGIFKNASDHFSVAGFKEGRSPRKGWTMFQVRLEKQK